MAFYQPGRSFASLHAGGYVIKYIDSEEVSQSHSACTSCVSYTSSLTSSVSSSHRSARLKPVMIEAVIESRHTLALPLVRDAIQNVEAEVRIAAFAAATSRLGLTESELILDEDEVWPVRAKRSRRWARAKRSISSLRCALGSQIESGGYAETRSGPRGLGFRGSGALLC